MLGATLGSPVPTLLRLVLPIALVALVLAAACGGDDAPEATSTVVPVPTIPTAPPQVRDDGAGPTALALGPRYNETTLALLPVAEPLGVRELVETIDANEAFEVRRFVSAGSDQPVVVGVCSPRAPNGVVLQTPPHGWRRRDAVRLGLRRHQRHRRRLVHGAGRVPPAAPSSARRLQHAWTANTPADTRGGRGARADRPGEPVHHYIAGNGRHDRRPPTREPRHRVDRSVAGTLVPFTRAPAPTRSCSTCCAASRRRPELSAHAPRRVWRPASVAGILRWPRQA